MAGSSSAGLSVIARPYAEAIFERAKETGTSDQWSDALDFLAKVVSDRDMLGLLASPQLTKPQLAELLLDIGDGVLDEEGRNLVRLLTANGRVGALPEIGRLYEQLRAEQEGRIEVEVIAAYSVSATQKKRIAEVMKRRLGKEVRVASRRDKGLIGGAIIRAGDLVIDGSVRGQLQHLAASLKT